MADAAESMNLSEEEKRVMKVLYEAINLVFHIYGDGFRDLEELHKAGATKEIAESVHFLLCDTLCNVRNQSEMEDKTHDLLKPNHMDDFCE